MAGSRMCLNKNIALLGSTGSIGRQTLDVVRANPEARVVSLAAKASVDLLEDQIREFAPRLVAVYDDEAAADLRVRVADLDVRVVSGMDGLCEAASAAGADVCVTAIVGMIGIKPTLAAIEAGEDIALANKETLVTAGHLIMRRAQEKGVNILPVDSEHSAIFQCLQGNENAEVSRLIITASGGPFRGMKREALMHVTTEQALRHPNWSMGSKITIDSATLVNKGLEVIEAGWLFSLPPEKIDVVIQPQSVIHSMVEFTDGAVMAQLGTPDMRLPIQYALTWPSRMLLPGERLDFAGLGKLDFEEPDTETFLGLPLAREAVRSGGTMPTVLNAANEEAVSLFLHEKIGFTQIWDAIEKAMASHRVIQDPGLDAILDTEREIRALVRSWS